MDGTAVAPDVLTLVLALGALVVALVSLGIIVRSRTGALGESPSNARHAELERRVAQLGQRLEVVEGDLDAGRRRTDGSAAESRAVDDGASQGVVTRRLGPALSHLGLVRFDAFDDTGGAQSFALALVDDDGDGVVLTSLHSRHVTRLYVKSIRGGTAAVPLSGEEEEALREAGLAP